MPSQNEKIKHIRIKNIQNRGAITIIVNNVNIVNIVNIVTY
jgi:hypothetical protein